MENIKSTNDLIDLFIRVATNNPNQVNKLFDKYVSFIRSHHYSLNTSRGIAARNLGLLADSRGPEEYDLLLRTIPKMRGMKKSKQY